MLGTPANSSTAVPSGRFSQTGQISVKNKAIPKLTGKAISSAIIEDITVPAIAISAPYSLLTGSHSMRVINPGPKCLNAGHAPTTSDAIMPTRISNTKAANAIVNLWNRKSCHFWAPDDAGGGATGRAMGVGPASVIGTLMVDMASGYALGWVCPDGREMSVDCIPAV